MENQYYAWSEFSYKLYFWMHMMIFIKEYSMKIIWFGINIKIDNNRVCLYLMNKFLVMTHVWKNKHKH